MISCILNDRVTGQSPFLRDSDEATISAITSATTLDLSNKELVHFSSECKDLICSNMLTRNPRRRMAAQQCLKHKWLLGGMPSYKRTTVCEVPSPSRRRRSLGSPGKRRGSLGGGEVVVEGKSDSEKQISSPARKQSTDNSQ